MVLLGAFHSIRMLDQRAVICFKGTTTARSSRVAVSITSTVTNRYYHQAHSRKRCNSLERVLGYKIGSSFKVHPSSISCNHISNMTSFIVLPTLTAWVEGGLSAILKSTTEEAFDSAFDRFISQHANITVNGQHLSRDNYKQQLLGESAVNKRAAEVKFDGVVEVSTDKEEPIKVIV